jgi:hypothetical protein
LCPLPLLWPPYYAYLYRPFGNDDDLGDTYDAVFSPSLYRTQVGKGNGGQPTSTALTLPYYDFYVEDEVDKPREGDNILPFTDNGMRIFSRYVKTEMADFTIYDITENENGTMSFTIVSGNAGIVNDPEFSSPPDVYSQEIDLALTSPDDNDIYYTLDGSDPRTNGTLYNLPLHIAGTVTVRAVCCDENGSFSNVAGGDFSCYAPSGGILPSYNGTGNKYIYYSTEYDVVNVTFGSYAAGYLFIIDTRLGYLGTLNMPQYAGKTISIPTTGTFYFQAYDTNTRFTVTSVTGMNQPVTANGINLYNEDFSAATSIVQGNNYFITSDLINNTLNYMPVTVLFAFYDTNSRLVNAKLTRQYLYKKVDPEKTGVFIQYIGGFKCEMFVWSGNGNITPYTYLRKSFTIR